MMKLELDVKDLSARDHIAITVLGSLSGVYWENQDLYESGAKLVQCQVQSSYDYADEVLRQRAEYLLSEKQYYGHE